MNLIRLTIHNSGAKALLLDLRTLRIKAGKNTFDAYHEDHLKNCQREVLIKPSDSVSIGIFPEIFLHKLKIQTPEKYDDRTFMLTYPLQLSVETVSGKRFTNKKLRYWEATGEFHRK